MEALQVILPIALAFSLASVVAAVGLDATLDDILYLFRHPRELIKAVIVVDVVVPVIAIVVAVLFPISLVSKAAILLMACSPVPPFVPGNELKVGGRKDYAYGLYAALILLSIITVPISVALVGAYFGSDVAISPAAVFEKLSLSTLLPLALGLAVRRFAPGVAAKVGPVLSKLGTLLLLIVLVPLLIKLWPAFATLVGDGTILAAAVVVALALAAGHLIGGPAQEDRAALAVTAATRHPGIAAMVAGANFEDKRVTAGIVLVLLIGILASTPYKMIIKRRHKAGGVPRRPPGAAHA